MKTIDTGLVRFELPFDRGMEEIFFNPNDIEFVGRIVDMMENISGIYILAEEEYNKDGIEPKEQLKILREANTKICDEFDFAFGNKVSDKMFKYCSPTSVVKGKNQYYTWYLLEMLFADIEKEVGVTMTSTNNNLKKIMDKHATNYIKR